MCGLRVFSSLLFVGESSGNGVGSRELTQGDVKPALDFEGIDAAQVCPVPSGGSIENLGTSTAA